jgi:hypothetical protein
LIAGIAESCELLIRAKAGMSIGRLYSCSARACCFSRKYAIQHCQGRVSMVHACGHGNCSTAIGHFPPFIVHMYLAALSKASGCLFDIFSLFMVAPL